MWQRILLSFKEFSVDIYEIFRDERNLQVITLFLLTVPVVNLFKIWPLSLVLLSLTTLFYIYAFLAKQQERFEQRLILEFFTLLVAFHIDLFAKIYQDLGIIDFDGNVIKSESETVYFSIVTWTTLGYGDFRPTEGARIYAAIEALLGYLYMAIFIGKVFHYFSRTNKTRNELDGSDEPPIR